MDFFVLGKMMDGKRASSSPKYLTLPPVTLCLLKSCGVVLDLEEPVNPFETGCDAFVMTDRGIHLFYVLPNRPGPYWSDMADPVHREMHADEPSTPLFFQSKDDHSKVRTCAPVTEAGAALALEYNTVAQYLVDQGRIK